MSECIDPATEAAGPRSQQEEDAAEAMVRLRDGAHCDGLPSIDDVELLYPDYEEEWERLVARSVCYSSTHDHS